jgi:serine/threonine-protein kinase RsbW
LEDLFAHAQGFAAAERLDERSAFAVELTLEELFTNLVRHNVGGRDQIEITLRRDGSCLVIRLEDFDVEPFDVSAVNAPDVRKELREREVGGLGIHLVKSLVDKLSYEYANRTLIVTAYKELGPCSTSSAPRTAASS